MIRLYSGTMNLSKGSLDLTDPCYDKETWCRKTVNKIKKGTWSCFYLQEAEDEGRIAQIEIVHDSVDINDIQRKYISVGSIGVDAGLAGFFENKPDYNDEEWNEICDFLPFDNPIIVNPDSCLKCTGFVSSSGYGDGCYEIFGLTDDHFEVVALKIVFFTEDYDEEDEYDEERLYNLYELYRNEPEDLTEEELEYLYNSGMIDSY